MCIQHFYGRASFTFQLSPFLIAMIVSFGEKFELSEKIGSGSFGEIFFTRNIKTGETLATKSEKKSKKAKSQLRREAKIYLMLSGTGIVY